MHVLFGSLVESSHTINRTPHRGIGGIFFRGRLIQNRGVPRRRMRILDSFGLVFITGGKGTFRDSFGNQQSCRAGNLLLLFPGVPHAYGNTDPRGWDEIFLLFTSPLIGPLLDQGFLQKDNPVWSLSPVDYWKLKFEVFLRDIPPEGEAGDLREIAMLLALLSQAKDQQERIFTGETERWVPHAKQQLGNSPAPLEEVARNLGMSYEKFRKQFKAATGMSPKQFRSQERIARARDRLRETSDTIQQIALEMEYCDPYHFSKQFKKFTGLTPTDFRSLHQAPQPGLENHSLTDR